MLSPLKTNAIPLNKPTPPNNLAQKNTFFDELFKSHQTQVLNKHLSTSDKNDFLEKTKAYIRSGDYKKDLQELVKSYTKGQSEKDIQVAIKHLDLNNNKERHLEAAFKVLKTLLKSKSFNQAPKEESIQKTTPTLPIILVNPCSTNTKPNNTVTNTVDNQIVTLFEQVKNCNTAQNIKNLSSHLNEINLLLKKKEKVSESTVTTIFKNLNKASFNHSNKKNNALKGLSITAKILMFSIIGFIPGLILYAAIQTIKNLKTSQEEQYLLALDNTANKILKQSDTKNLSQNTLSHVLSNPDSKDVVLQSIHKHSTHLQKLANSIKTKTWSKNFLKFLDSKKSDDLKKELIKDKETFDTELKNTTVGRNAIYTLNNKIKTNTDLINKTEIEKQSLEELKQKLQHITKLKSDMNSAKIFNKSLYATLEKKYSDAKNNFETQYLKLIHTNAFKNLNNPKYTPSRDQSGKSQMKIIDKLLEENKNNSKTLFSNHVYYCNASKNIFKRLSNAELQDTSILISLLSTQNKGSVYSLIKELKKRHLSLILGSDKKDALLKEADSLKIPSLIKYIKKL
jgi:hypothetical protein